MGEKKISVFAVDNIRIIERACFFDADVFYRDVLASNAQPSPFPTFCWR